MTVAPREQGGLTRDRPLLVLHHVSKQFGGVKALNDVSCEVRQGELFGVIGPNGAGKSTLLSLISGAQHPSAGEILFEGQPLERLPPHVIARLGIGRAHQIPRPFRHMTVQQNVLLPAHSHQSGRTESHLHTREILRLAACKTKSLNWLLPSHYLI